jgi:hypothetical protein
MTVSPSKTWLTGARAASLRKEIGDDVFQVKNAPYPFNLFYFQIDPDAPVDADRIFIKIVEKPNA